MTAGEQRYGLKQRLSRVYWLQISLITLVALLSVAVTTFFLERVLIKRALQGEAEHFWLQHASKPDFPVPQARHLQGFIEPTSKLPDIAWTTLPIGLHSKTLAGQDYRVYVSANQQGQRLYLLYSNEQVRKLVALYGLVPLTAVLILLYLSHWLAYRASSRAISPITHFAQAVNRFEPATTTAAHFKPDDLSTTADFELYTLSQAMHGFARRLERFVERERMFTRDASHELRTPLTVIKASVDTLAEQSSDQAVHATLDRIRRASLSMEELIKAFLMLARESSERTGADDTSVPAVLKNELADARFLLDDKPIRIEESYANDLLVSVPSNIVSVFFGNLIRNAVCYTAEGYISISVSGRQVCIQDTGCGIQKANIERVFTPFFREAATASPGSGVGMAIVKRIADRFKWAIDIDSEVGVGTLITVTLDRASEQPL